MFKKLSIRLRLTILSALLLMVCCIGLTVVLNFSALKLADTIDATYITSIAVKVSDLRDEDKLIQEGISTIPTINVQEAKKVFGLQSIIYMFIVIIGGSALTYYISGKALKPLDILNGQVKNINISNLSETLDVPPVKDEISELTQSFNEMAGKLNDSFVMQKRFSASAAHELRTPLAVLQTKIDVFNKKENHNNSDYKDIVNVFQKQIGRLRSLVGNLLDMTNMDDEREQSEILLKDILDDIICELSAIATNKNVILSLNCDDSVVFGNIDLIYRAFYNLIENGIKYNKIGGIVEVDVVKNKQDKVQVMIKDSGIGISDEMKKQIFEPFYRVDKSRSREMGGAGLGLSIVDSIIKKQGGTITVLNNNNGGTCFEVVL